MNDDEPIYIPPHVSTDGFDGIVRDSSGEEVFAKSLAQRSDIHATRETEWESFITQNPGAPECPDDCSCRKFSHK